MLTLEEIKKKMQGLQDWALEGQAIVKDLHFQGGFKEAMVFVNKVAEIAEKHNHHPTILIEYNYVRLTLTTHSSNSLTHLDFLVAEDIDKI